MIEQSAFPPELPDIVASISNPDVVAAEITTTPSGDWAILVRTRPGTRTPIAAVEQQARGFHVLYDVHRGFDTVARPAYPGKGE
jgi:hypothetical protein